ASVGGKPDRAVGVLGQAQHRALWQLVLVPDMVELADRPVRIQRQRAASGEERANGAQRHHAEALGLTQHAVFQTSAPLTDCCYMVASTAGTGRCTARRPAQPRTAASIAATSILPICIIAANARRATSGSGWARASVSTRGVICQFTPQ